MADISMCTNHECSLKDTCYRYLAKPNKYWQSYIKAEPVDNECEFYWKYNKKKEDTDGYK